MKWIDLPPVWLLGGLVIAWGARWPMGWSGSPVPGLFLIALAVLAGIAAALEFLRARTTIIPREGPSALITGGIYRFTRNPIYLADLFFLAGASVCWGSAIGVLLVPALGWLLQRRYILGEEARLSQAFGPAYEDYRRRVRRWL